MTYKAYAGIGSRKTPDDILNMMTNFAELAESLGWTLRSGGAEKADSAFEAGVEMDHMKEIYLPWGAFNGSKSMRTHPSTSAMEMASRIHPNWDACTDGAKKLHARNVHQILGPQCITKDAVKFVICWTPEASVVGGTATALRLASMYRIPIFNLAAPIDEAALEAIVRA